MHWRFYLWLLLALIVIGWHCFSLSASQSSSHFFPCLPCWLFLFQLIFFHLVLWQMQEKNIILFYASVAMLTQWVPNARSAQCQLSHVYQEYIYGLCLFFLNLHLHLHFCCFHEWVPFRWAHHHTQYDCRLNVDYLPIIHYYIRTMYYIIHNWIVWCMSAMR